MDDDLRRKMIEIDRRLAAAYGQLEQPPHLDPVSQLVGTILSQNTNDRNRDLAFNRLRGRLPTWAEVRDADLDLVIDAKTSYVRQHALRWSDIEVNQGERNWTAMADMEQALIQATNAGIKTVLIVHGTPTWAQVTDGICSRIQVDKIPAFAAFLYDAVSRYSKPPYNIEYWEIWNEPDVAFTYDLANAPYGCWGDDNDKYYGGGYFAEVLKVVYPMIKAANPNAKVIVGGLLLDCDPRGETSYCDKVNHNERPPKYLEGILVAGGGNYFDGVSYHAYDYFSPEIQMGHYQNSNWGAAWNTTGPVSSLKAQFLREVLSKYGFSNKFLINTEAAVVCLYETGCEADSTSAYEQTKASYVAQTYSEAIKDQLVANIWYSLLGWRNSELLNSDLTPRPAFIAYQVGRAELRNAIFKQVVTAYPGVEIYEFQRGQKTIWLAWSLDGNNHTITLPSLPDSIQSFLGETITPSQQIEVTLRPVYIDWLP